MKLKKLTDNDYMLRTEDRVVGSFLFDCYDDEVGRIESILVEPDSFVLRYCLVTVGGFLSTRGKTLLVPKNLVEPKGIGKVVCSKSQASISDAPAPYNLDEISREDEQEIHDYFGLQPYYEKEEASAPEEIEETKEEGVAEENEREDDSNSGL